MPGLAFAHFLGAAMVEANIRYHIDNFLAIELEDEAHRAMRARVLWTEIEEHEIRLRTATLEAPCLGVELQGRLLDLLLVIWELEGVHVGGTCRMVFAQRMPGPCG